MYITSMTWKVVLNTMTSAGNSVNNKYVCLDKLDIGGGGGGVEFISYICNNYQVC